MLDKYRPTIGPHQKQGIQTRPLIDICPTLAIDHMCWEGTYVRFHSDSFDKETNIKPKELCDNVVA